MGKVTEETLGTPARLISKGQETEKRQAKRLKASDLNPRVVIGPNDIIVDTEISKIKIKTEEEMSQVPVVKEEATDNMEEDDQCDDFIECSEVFAAKREVDLDNDIDFKIEQDQDATDDSSISSHEDDDDDVIIDIDEQEFKSENEDDDTSVEVKQEQLTMDNLPENIEDLRTENMVLKKLLEEKDNQILMLTEQNRRLKLERDSASSEDDLEEVNETDSDDESDSDGESVYSTSSLEPETMETVDFVDYPIKYEDCSDLTNVEKVMDLFMDILHVIVRKERGRSVINWNKHVPFLKKCRQVCKFWKDSVDRLLEQHPSHLEQLELSTNEASLEIYKKHFTPSWAKLQNCEDVDIAKIEVIEDSLRVFLEYQATDPFYNPLPTRHLMIKVTIRDHQKFAKAWNKFSNIVLSYLLHFGKQIWYFTVIISCNDFLLPDKSYVYTLLSQWLELTPNVKSLALDIINVSDLNEKEENANIDFQRLSIPHFPELISFQSGRECTDDNFLHCLLKKNAHVKKLHLKGSSYIRKLMEITFSNLSQMYFSVQKTEHFLYYRTYAVWNIEKLILTIPCANLMKTAEIVVEKFKYSLKSLKLIVPFREQNVNIPQMSIRVPGLKNLHVKGGHCSSFYFGSPFLAKLNALESFTIEQNMLVFPFANVLVTVSPQSVCLPEFPSLKNVTFILNAGRKSLESEGHEVIRRVGMEALTFSIVKIYMKNK